jgi:hypothetical protein
MSDIVPKPLLYMQIPLLFIAQSASSHLPCFVIPPPPNHHHMAVQPNSGPGLPFWDFVTITFLQGWIVSSASNLENQASVFMTPGDRVAQLYPQVLGIHFSRLLRHAWVTVGLLFVSSIHLLAVKNM